MLFGLGFACTHAQESLVMSGRARRELDTEKCVFGADGQANKDRVRPGYSACQSATMAALRATQKEMDGLRARTVDRS